MSISSLKRLGKNKWTLSAVIAFVLILSGAGYYYYNAERSHSKNETSLATSTIRTGDIVLSANGLGTLIPGKEVSFGFGTSGQASEVLVALGDKVEAGRVLARLENKTLSLQYDQAKANYEALTSPSAIAAAEQAIVDAEASLATAKDDLQYMIGPEMFVAEEEVAKAQQVLESAKAAAVKNPSDTNKQEVSEAESTLTKAQDTLTYAFHNYSNSYTRQTFTFPIRNDKGTTVRRDLIAPTDADLLGARAAYELAQASLSDAQNYLDVLQGKKTAQEVPASSITALTEAKNALDSAEAGLKATELIAPISGTVTSLDLKAGEDVGTTAVLTISDLDQPYTIDVSLDQTDWDKAKVGNAASVTFDLLPNDPYPGKVVEVYPALDDSSGTSMIHIKVQMDSAIRADLPSGASASVDVTGGQALGAVLVPVSALKEVGSGQYIVYVMENGQPVQQEVQIGLQDIVNAEVKSGLKPGDIVLTNAEGNQ